MRLCRFVVAIFMCSALLIGVSACEGSGGSTRSDAGNAESSTTSAEEQVTTVDSEIDSEGESTQQESVTNNRLPPEGPIDLRELCFGNPLAVKSLLGQLYEGQYEQMDGYFSSQELANDNNNLSADRENYFISLSGDGTVNRGEITPATEIDTVTLMYFVHDNNEISSQMILGLLESHGVKGARGFATKLGTNDCYCALTASDDFFCLVQQLQPEAPYLMVVVETNPKTAVFPTKDTLDVNFQKVHSDDYGASDLVEW